MNTRPKYFIVLASLVSSLYLFSFNAMSNTPFSNTSINQNELHGKLNHIHFLNRITWGANESSAKQLHALGIDAYLKQQLQAKDSKLPTEIQRQIDAMTISQKSFMDIMSDLDEQREAAAKTKKTDNDLSKAYRQEQYRLYNEAASRSLLRSLYSQNQLYEQMNWFWMNHFNISNRKGNVRAMLGDFEESAIRPHALGNFRDLLRATVLHPAMLRYLDNEHNAVDRINENYARELMELHTMGVGSGYTQTDVQELARVLTGLGVNFKRDAPRQRRLDKQGYVRFGLTEFNPKRHDFNDKKILGMTIKGEGMAEIEQVLDLLMKQAATAKFISQKLAVYFVSDQVSKELVDAMAKQFLQSKGNIPSVLATLFYSPEFAASLGKKFKDPLHYVISSLRLAYDTQIIVNTKPILNWMNDLGQEANGHQTPDGYSMKEAAWSSPAQMTSRFDIAKSIARGTPNLFKDDTQDDTSPKMKLNELPRPHLSDSDFVKNITVNFSDNTQSLLLKNESKQDWNTLFLASPEMMRR